MDAGSGRRHSLSIPGTEMTNFDILRYVDAIPIPNFIGVFMRDQLPISSRNILPQYGIMNLNTSKQRGIHWVGWVCTSKTKAYYFDSFGLDVPIELYKYLKIEKKVLIQSNINVVQTETSSECGRLCLFVLKCLSKEIPYDNILQTLKIRYDETNTAKINKKPNKDSR